MFIFDSSTCAIVCVCVSFLLLFIIKAKMRKQQNDKNILDKRKNKIASSVIAVELFTLIMVTFMRYEIFMQSLPRSFFFDQMAMTS